MADNSQPPPLVAVSMADDALHAMWQDGTEARIPFLWLRHNCDCAACVVTQTAEKRIQIGTVPADLRPASAAVEPAADALVLAWPDGHRTRYAGAALRNLLHPVPRQLRYWHGNFAPERFDFNAFLADDATAAIAIDEFLAAGACLLTRAPTTPGSVERLCRRLGPIREVLFERIHNVELDPAGYNIAHTGEDVPPHNDMVSYAWPPSVQALHMLRNDCAGGESGLVDGFAVLREFRQEQPAMFDVLCQVPVPFRQFDAANETFATEPTIELDCSGELRLLRFSNQLMQQVSLAEPRLAEFYRAYQALARRINAPAARACFRLAAGEVLLTAGHRVLHARTPITSVGRRHLQDAYFDHDNVRNHLRLLERQGRLRSPSQSLSHIDSNLPSRKK